MSDISKKLQGMSATLAIKHILSTVCLDVADYIEQLETENARLAADIEIRKKRMRMFEEAVVSMTEQCVEQHPDDYDWACNCQSCQSYAEA